ncbi:MAG: vitamin B12 dependent-methionine synthase activation domain-containing protein [Oscillospiraceae bacterium]
MRFDDVPVLDEAAVFRALGGAAFRGDAQAVRQVQAAGRQMAAVATPRWIYRYFELEWPLALRGAQLPLPGKNIAAHLAGCAGCVLLAVTLGAGVEQAITAAEAGDLAEAVLLDAVASSLVEQYADLAEALVKQDEHVKDKCFTGRFSPGYGDFPTGIQADFLRVLDTQRKIGLTVSTAGIMLPRKSITAVVGVASHPVSGRLAGCEQCAIRERCEMRREGAGCGAKTD